MRAKTHRLLLNFLLFFKRFLHKLEHLIKAAPRRAKFLLKNLSPVYVGMAVATGLVLFATIYAIAFFWPRTVSFSYAKGGCLFNPVVLPNVVSKNTGSTYRAVPVTKLTVAGYPVYSQSTCVRPVKAPTENTQETIKLGRGLFQKRIKVVTGQFPQLNDKTVLERPIPTQDSFIIKLSSSDVIFNYQLQANNKRVLCTKQTGRLACDVSKLELAQSATYDFKLERFFKDQPAGVIFEHKLTTVESVHVTATSLSNGQIIYDKRNDFSLTLNRPVTAIEGAHLYLMNGDKREDVPITASVDGVTITVKSQQPLARSASFVFWIDHVSAADGGFLTEPYSLSFKTSGGPKVARVNIPTYKVPPSSNVVVSFDTTLGAGQDWQNFVRLEAGGAAVPATITASNNTITITPASALPRCAALTVKVLDGLQNSFGVTGGSAWQYKSRVTCQAISSIGSSVQGRSLTTYSFGNGPSRMVFVGGTHGDEPSSTYLLNRWIEELEANGNIPAQRTIVVIPNLNPDGSAMNRRTNANNVDLNRNFPTNNWKSSVVMPDKSTNPTGGGTYPLSEPESRALANYLTGSGARLVLTYHAIAGTVIPNDAGDSVALARVYDQKSNVGFASNSQTTSIFAYDTTGSLEDWLYDKPGIPALLVELWSRSDNEFSKHQSALWAMVQIP